MEFERVLYVTFGLRVQRDVQLAISTTVLYTYDIENNIWARPETFGDIPGPRAFHSANVVRGEMFLFGGSGLGTISAWKHDLSS